MACCFSRFISETFMARKNKRGKNEHSHSDKKGKTERTFFYISNLPPRPSI